MPIKFRCPHCRQFLGISRSKAGEIADCPMCGKTVRVPNLDGSVKPLPKPKLDLQDSSLVNALGELASIGSDVAHEHESHEHQPDGRPGNELATIAVQPTAEPVVLEPLVPAEPIVISAPSSPRKHSRNSAPGRSPLDTTPSVATEEATLDEPDVSVSAVESRQAFSAGRPQRTRLASSPAWVPIAIVVSLFLLGSLGLVLMNRTSAPPAVAADQQAETGSAPQAAVASADSAVTPAVTGRITYVSDAGDTRPDDGAKVIALPAQRGGTIKLDVAGFMVGSDEVDEHVAAAALRALGGDVVTADEHGEFSVSLSAAGRYQLLVISRHQSRSWEVGVETNTQELLDRFFIRPTTLLGQLAYEVHPLQYRGHGTSPQDFAFTRN